MIFPRYPMTFPCSNVFFLPLATLQKAIAWSVIPLSCGAYVFQLLAVWGSTRDSMGRRNAEFTNVKHGWNMDDFVVILEKMFNRLTIIRFKFYIILSTLLNLITLILTLSEHVNTFEALRICRFKMSQNLRRLMVHRICPELNEALIEANNHGETTCLKRNNRT